jgi:autotransporter strand-loop-strand O-heptosyltransferase
MSINNTMNENIFFNSTILGLGDTIALIPFVDIYAKNNLNKNILFYSEFNSLFEKEYQNIRFVNNEYQILRLKRDRIFAEHNRESFECKEIYHMGYFTLHLINDVECLFKNERLPLQNQMAKFLNINFEKEIKPKISVSKNYNNIYGKYICIATQTTAQGKYWNYPNGWDIIINYLNKLGYNVICIDKKEKYGNLVYTNVMPINAINKTGVSLTEAADLINNSEFFIGLDSGLSWLAWALNKKVIQILGLTGRAISFKNPYSILNENVCNSCFSDKNIKQFDTDIPFNNFIMCPKHQDSSRIFECTKSITPNMVIEKIDQILHEKSINNI